MKKDSGRTWDRLCGLRSESKTPDPFFPFVVNSVFSLAVRLINSYNGVLFGHVWVPHL